MNTLKPHLSEKAKFLLEAEAHPADSNLKFEFCLIDKANLFDLADFSQKWSAEQVARTDGLWNHTCFEAFLNPLGMELYYEFNFSLKPAWNLYQFDRYRHPQPPKQSQDFELKSILWDPFESKVVVQLLNKTKYKKFKVGLAAVLEEKTGLKHYCALAHKSAKPDFYLQESFTLNYI